MNAVATTVSLLFALASGIAKPYTYKETCWYSGPQSNYRRIKGTCKITELRNSDGGLERREINVVITSKDHSINYTAKTWFDRRGCRTWDSDSKKDIECNYQCADVPQEFLKSVELPSISCITSVSKELWVRDISWD